MIIPLLNKYCLKLRIQQFNTSKDNNILTFFLNTHNELQFNMLVHKEFHSFTPPTKTQFDLTDVLANLTLK